MLTDLPVFHRERLIYHLASKDLVLGEVGSWLQGESLQKASYHDREEETPRAFVLL